MPPAYAKPSTRPSPSRLTNQGKRCSVETTLDLISSTDGGSSSKEIVVFATMGA